MQVLPQTVIYLQYANAMAAAKIFEDALSLSADDRLKLAAELLASVDEQGSPQWEAAWTIELQRRLEDSAVAGSPWSEVRSRIDARLRQK